jgi:hypothetical protein
MSLHILFCDDVVPLYFILCIEVVQHLNLNLIQRSLKR